MTMSVHYAKSVWGYDKRWIRVEAVDERGRALGIVGFEPNCEGQTAPRIADNYESGGQPRSAFGNGLPILQPALLVVHAVVRCFRRQLSVGRHWRREEPGTLA
jgi:hypothetical protein